MAIRSYKPYTPSRRTATGSTFAEVTKDRPERSLTAPRKQKAGRDSAGHISIRHRGGGAKRRYRLIDYRRERLDAVAEVIAVEYDPNRSAFIALLQYEDGEKRYILCPEGLKPGAKVVASETAEPAVGNCLPLSEIPVGTNVHNIELYPGRGGQLARSAGNSAQLMAKEGK
ncbi:MAG: 50S ribosomal protein L2, partial [Kiritimatiellae bacterium]|nr:50S ribosomal protein L2 [Kiritimatiellia bacterium]